jgi:hypothetical protein
VQARTGLDADLVDARRLAVRAVEHVRRLLRGAADSVERLGEG